MFDRLSPSFHCIHTLEEQVQAYLYEPRSISDASFRGHDLRCIQVNHESSTISAFPPQVCAHRPSAESAKVWVSASAGWRGIFLVDGIEAVRELQEW